MTICTDAGLIGYYVGAVVLACLLGAAARYGRYGECPESGEK